MPFLSTLLEKKREVDEEEVSMGRAKFPCFLSIRSAGKIGAQLLGGDGLVTSQASGI